ncbi:heavy-metal-associated domain-containing protein [Maribellus sediminis]|uniref:heavy-metal-associated domain-containing protein n=1 Tax=Maribellus sediminis TaxID=2696285 RepID=UPI0014322430|nr:heavy-metal-associated domain-containing protein [Maribellus sediminis]
MEQVKLKTDLSCPHCAMKVEPILKETKGIVDYSIDLAHPDKLVSFSSEGADIDALITNIKKAGYIAEKL